MKLKKFSKRGLLLGKLFEYLRNFFKRIKLKTTFYGIYFKIFGEYEFGRQN